MHRLDISPSPPGLVVPVPGLQGVVHLPPGGRVQPGQVEGLGVVLDAEVGVRGGEDEEVGHVHDADGGQTDATVLGLEVVFSGPGLAGSLACNERKLG